MAQLTVETITGEAAGVPFVAVPPPGARDGSAPVVLAWHLLDPPRTEAAFAAALPLHGLEAWRIYLGLPMTGRRLPEGGWEDLMRRASEDPVLRLYGPIAEGAAAESGPALIELRDRLGLDDAPVGLVGGSIGAAVAQLVLADGSIDAAAAVLISPVVQLRPVIDATAAAFGTTYEWSSEGAEIARRLDFVARAGSIARRGAAVLAVVGEDDDAHITEPAASLTTALCDAGMAGAVELATVPSMGHALAEEPGVEPAPQTPSAAAVDRLAVAWLRQHLGR